MLTTAVLLLATLAASEPPKVANGATAPGAASAPDAAKPAPVDPQSIKCRSIKEVNSRIPTRICRTVAEWDRIDADNQQAMTDQKRGGGQKPASGTIFE